MSLSNFLSLQAMDFGMLSRTRFILNIYANFLLVYENDWMQNFNLYDFNESI